MTFDDRPLHSRSTPDTTRAEGDDPDTGYPPSAIEPELITEDTAESEKKRQGSLIREIIETLLLALIIFVAVRAVVLNFRVDGLSMTPSMQDNEMVLVNRNAYLNFDSWALVDWLPFVEHEQKNVVYPFDPPERGDVIVFDAPVNNADKPYIKRVIGLPGETIEIHDDHVYIDGQRIDEPYLEGERTYCPGQRACQPVTVPDGHVFVMGDNRDNSQDSRAFGPVDVDNIIGKAWVTYWPFDAAGVVPHYDYPELAEQP
jgi:signal peptidase I